MATVEDLHHDALTGVLRLLDAQALAAASCATTRLRALASQPHLWESLCLSAWPSLRHPRLLRLLRSSPGFSRSLFSDAHTFPHPAGTRAASADATPPSLLISAVDLFHRGKPVFSRVVETDTRGPWFLYSPCRVDVLERKDPSPPPPLLDPQELTLSWVVVDPAGHRAINLSSRHPVSVERQWYTGEVLVRFGVVLDGGRAAATVLVACDEETMQPREVRLTVEDVDGMLLDGGESLAVLHGALEGQRKGWGEAAEAEARRRYTEYAARKRDRKERRLNRQGRLQAFFAFVSVSLFMALLASMAL